MRYTSEGRDCHCTAQMVISGPGLLAEMHPQAGTEYAFDDDGTPSGDGFEAHAMERTYGPVQPGTYTVRVNWAVFGGGSWRLDDYMLVIEAWKL